MFLERVGKPLPAPFNIHSFSEAPLEPNIIGGYKPKHLQVLGRTLWPDEIKKKIVALYEPEGIDALQEKLVEPTARVFGGIDRDGEDDLSKVNWDFAIDYFTWELESIKRTKKAYTLQDKALEKWGFMFWHYGVYEDYRPMYDGD